MRLRRTPRPVVETKRGILPPLPGRRERFSTKRPARRALSTSVKPLPWGGIIQQGPLPKSLPTQTLLLMKQKWCAPRQVILLGEQKLLHGRSCRLPHLLETLFLPLFCFALINFSTLNLLSIVLDHSIATRRNRAVGRGGQHWEGCCLGGREDRYHGGPGLGYRGTSGVPWNNAIEPWQLVFLNLGD